MSVPAQLRLWGAHNKGQWGHQGPKEIYGDQSTQLEVSATLLLSTTGNRSNGADHGVVPLLGGLLDVGEPVRGLLLEEPRASGGRVEHVHRDVVGRLAVVGLQLEAELLAYEVTPAYWIGSLTPVFEL